MQFADNRSRRLAGGTSLILGPGLMLTGWAISPTSGGDQTQWVADMAAAPAQGALGITFVIAGATLMVFAFLSLVHLLREHEPVWGDVGGALAIIGGVVSAAMMGLALAEIEVIRELGAGASTVALIDTIEGSAAVTTVYVVGLLRVVGMLMLAYALYESRTAPRPLTLTFAAGVIVETTGIFIFSFPVIIVGTALLFIGLAGMGVLLITESDEDWEHAPTFDGFRPITGT